MPDRFLQNNFFISRVIIGDSIRNLKMVDHIMMITNGPMKLIYSAKIRIDSSSHTSHIRLLTMNYVMDFFELLVGCIIMKLKESHWEVFCVWCDDKIASLKSIEFSIEFISTLTLRLSTQTILLSCVFRDAKFNYYA